MENENLASDIIKGLIKVIIALIVTNILSVAGFLIYLSLPVDYVETEKCYQEAYDNGKGQSVESLEKMLDGIVAFVEDIQNDPEQMEEKEVVNHYIRKLREM